MNWTHRIAAAAGAAVVAVAVLAPAAGAQPSTGYAPVTLSPEQVARICEQRVPRLEQRADRLLTRINGGPEVAGSVAALRAKADKAKAAGNQARADRLAQRADRRAGRVDDLRRAQQRLGDFKRKHCGR